MPEPTSMVVLDQKLARLGTSLAQLRREAHAIVFFGSRATGCATLSSDWDLLVVGRGRSRKEAGLDLVQLERSLIESRDWLGTDLAGHVAAHGVWLHGTPSWDIGSVDFTAAARRKEARVARTIQALSDAWSALGSVYQEKHATLLRRDAQRLALLQRALPIPPSAVLDARWLHEDTCGWLAETLALLGAAPVLTTALRFPTRAIPKKRPDPR